MVKSDKLKCPEMSCLVPNSKIFSLEEVRNQKIFKIVFDS